MLDDLRLYQFVVLANKLHSLIKHYVLDSSK